MLTAFATAMGKKEGERIIPRTAAWRLSCPIHRVKAIIMVSSQNKEKRKSLAFSLAKEESQMDFIFFQR